MFQNISFTFLCALALISWLLLCYLDNVEEQETIPEYHVELYTERSTSADVVPKNCPRNSFIDRMYDMVLGCGIVVICSVALSNLLYWLELLARSYLQKEPDNLMHKESLPFIEIESIEPIEENKRDDEVPPIRVQENAQLKEQLNDLQARCQELIQELREANENSGTTAIPCNSSKSSFSASEDEKESSGVIMFKEPVDMKSNGLSVTQPHEPLTLTSTTQNVYVTHSHFHFNFNGPVHLTQQNVNVGMLRSKNVRKRSEFLQVWGTYIKGPKERPMLTGINNILM